MSKEIQLKNVTIFRKNILGMFDVIKYLVYIIRERLECIRLYFYSNE